MKNQATGFEPEDIKQNKQLAALGYVLFFLPLINCSKSTLGRFCANQGLLLALTYIALRVVLKWFRWLFIFNFVYNLAVIAVSLCVFAIGVYLAYQLMARDRVTRLPYIGRFTLIK